MGEITTKGGLLWEGGRVIDLPRADQVAREHGFEYAERMVKSLEKFQKEKEEKMG